MCFLLCCIVLFKQTGTNVPTPETLLYAADIAYRQAMRRPYNIVTGPGDGTITLESLRLCCT
jgi:hypothetical protein